MWSVISKALVTALMPKVVEELPKLIEKAFDDLMEDVDVIESIKEFFTTEEDIAVIEEITAPSKPDTTQLTQWDFNSITFFHEDWEARNKGKKMKDRISMDELIFKINKRLGLHKSRTAISAVWQGSINKEALPIGSDPNEFPRELKKSKK